MECSGLRRDASELTSGTTAPLYNFIVTDPEAEQGFLARANGVYPLNNIHLCISLTEAYEGDRCCHKLMATILSDQPLRD